MKVMIKSLTVSNLHSHGPATSWLGRPYIPADTLFPSWITGRVLLKDFHSKTIGWVFDSEGSDIQMGLGFPWVQDVCGNWVPMAQTFPPEVRYVVEYIAFTVMWDYTPSLREVRGLKNDPTMTERIRAMVQRHEQQIISEGGRPVLAELAFRLGVM